MAEGGSMKISGKSPAALRYGYQVAAELTDWTIAKVPGSGWSLHATVKSKNVHRVSQRPLMLEVKHTHGVWRWPVESLQINGAQLGAALGLRERNNV